MSIHAPVGVIAWTGVAEESRLARGQRGRQQAEPGGTSEQGGLLIYDFVFAQMLICFNEFY